jgi:hypothetical protein
MDVSTGVSPTTDVGTAPVVSYDVLVLRLVYIIATKYAWIFTVVFGLFGNMMSIIITLQKDNRRISTCNYMAALAMADSIVVVNECAWRTYFHFWDSNPPTELDMQ